MILDERENAWRFTEDNLKNFRCILSGITSENTDRFIHSIENICNTYKSAWDCGGIDYHKVDSFMNTLKKSISVLTSDHKKNIMLKMFKDYPLGSKVFIQNDLEELNYLMNQAASCMDQILCKLETYNGFAKKGSSSTSSLVNEVAAAYVIYIGDITCYAESPFAKTLRIVFHAVGYSHEEADVMRSIRSYLEAEKKKQDYLDSLPPGCGLTMNTSLRVPEPGWENAKRLKKSMKKT
jgi:hypothetical protein